MRILKYLLFLALFQPFNICLGQSSYNVKLDSHQKDQYTKLLELSKQTKKELQESAFRFNPILKNLKKIKPLFVGETPINKMWFSLTFENSPPSLWELNSIFGYIEPNTPQKLHHQQITPPNDPKKEEQWYHSYIQTFEAWDSTQGDSSITIGIIDTGIDYGHPEFVGQLRINVLEDINGSGTFEPWADDSIFDGLTGDLDGIDQDQNGFPDDVIGYDFTDQPRSPFGGDYLQEDPIPWDDNSHGTFVAGIVGGKANNHHGGTGIAPGCKLLAIRAFSSSGIGEDDDIARAIIYAANNSVDVLNFSFGDIYPSEMVHDAVRYAHEKGVIMVGSAGNGTGDQIHYPSNFNEVISVSGSDIGSSGNEILWPLSSFGFAVDLAAPGSNIYSTIPRDTSNIDPYDYSSGTSTSAPMVSSAVALLLSQKPGQTLSQIRSKLQVSADDISREGWDHYTGAGRLNIERALRTVGAGNVQISSPESDFGSPQNEIPIVGSCVHPRFNSYVLEYQKGIEGGDTWIPFGEEINEQKHMDTLGLWNLGVLDSGEYTLKLRVNLNSGTSIEDRIRFIKDNSAPTITIINEGDIWDNHEKKYFVHFRSSDIGNHQCFYRKKNETEWNSVLFDKRTYTGWFILNEAGLSSGEYEYYINTKNSSGLEGNSSIHEFEFESVFFPQYGFRQLEVTHPPGQFLSTTHDFDQDGRTELIFSDFSKNLGFGKLSLSEYNGGWFSTIDSINTPPVLIPKDLKDFDNNGLEDLLCSVNDSIYIYEQEGPLLFPKKLKWSLFAEGLFPARFWDFDSDGISELILKDSRDYYLYRWDGATFFEYAKLEDFSPDYEGSVAPLVLIEDFDGDQKTDLVFGDYDGDWIMFEEASPNNWEVVQIDSSELIRTGAYLCEGDINGNGSPNLVVAGHTSPLYNSDFEYNPPFWEIKVFESTADNQYQKIWSKFIFDMDVEGLNTLSCANIDDDPETEILLSTFPRTYIFDGSGGTIEGKWFNYGDLTENHPIGDFNKNGIAEFGLGITDSLVFMEYDFNYLGPSVAENLQYELNYQSEVLLSWTASPNATEYLIFRGEFNGVNTQIELIDSSSNNSYLDQSTLAGEEYLYVILSKNQVLTPPYSDNFSNPVVVLIEGPFGLDSCSISSSTQMELYFDKSPKIEEINPNLFELQDSINPAGVNKMSEFGKVVLLSFSTAIPYGQNTISVSDQLHSNLNTPLDSLKNMAVCENTINEEELIFLQSWEIINDKTAFLIFSDSLNYSLINNQNFQVIPEDNIMSVIPVPNNPKGVEITLDKLVLGSIGYDISIIVEGIEGIAGEQLPRNEGNVATFSGTSENLEETFVFPNPYYLNSFHSEIIFSNVPLSSVVHIYSPEGRRIKTLTETEHNGGIKWNMRDEGNNLIRKGIYIYRVLNAEGTEFHLGQFGIIE